MTDNTGSTDDSDDDDIYNDPQTIGSDVSGRIAQPDDTDERQEGSGSSIANNPLVPERTQYDLDNRGTLDEVEDGSQAPGGEDHGVKEGTYDASNDQLANIETADEADGTR
jgi:hypothetical protein